MVDTPPVAEFSKPPGCRIQVRWIETECGSGNELNHSEEFCGNTLADEDHLLKKAKDFVTRELKPKFDSGTILTVTIVRVLEILSD